MRRLRGLLLVIGFGLVVGASACMWDRDTLAVEAKGHMDFVGAMVGLFDRNPPLYYEMRLKRVAEQLKTDPSNLDLYDDAGVAAARLDKFPEAMAWMARKKAAMKPLDMKNQASKDAWYRYYSNLGTFTSYDLFADDRSPAHLQRLKQAIDLIGKGLKINPNAHFGREAYQLKLVQWVLDVKTGKFKNPLSDYLAMGIDDVDAPKAVTGYVGLVRLGRAWGSPDVFAVLRDATSYSGDAYLAQLAEFRRQELVASGAKPLIEDDRPEDQRYPMMMPEGTTREFHLNEFRRLRKEAEKVVADRANFMNAKMREGKHPDTDLQFWVGYVEPPPLQVRQAGYFDTQEGKIRLMVIGGIGVLCVAPSVLLTLGWLWLRKRRRIATV